MSSVNRHVHFLLFRRDPQISAVKHYVVEEFKKEKYKINVHGKLLASVEVFHFMETAEVVKWSCEVGG